MAIAASERGGGAAVLDRPRPVVKELSQTAQPVRKDLPVAQHAQELAQLIEEGSVIIVEAQTGSGKTTELPKIVHKLLSQKGSSGNVLVTEPRKFAADSVSDFLSKSYPPGVVGCWHKGRNTVKDNTRIVFTVDGSLINEIKRNKFLKGYEAIIVDEVDVDSIFLHTELGLLKKIQAQRRAQGLAPLKIILTSGTLDRAKLSAYFPGAKAKDIEGRSYEIEDIFSDHEAAREDIAKEAAEKIVQILKNSKDDGDILSFMPGRADIEATIQRVSTLLTNEPSIRDSIDLIPLMGGNQDYGVQDKIYNKGSKRRIIVATNVAESSVTIDGVRHVVISGYKNVNKHDENTGLSFLDTVSIAKTNAKQQRGRAGRTATGTAYYLMTKEQYERDHPDRPEAEILHSDIVPMVLQLKAMGEDVYTFDYIDHPGKEKIDKAVEILKRLGALDKNGNIIEAVGGQMEQIPVDTRYARMLVEAKNSGSKECMEAVSVLVGILNNRNSVFNNRDKFFNQRYAQFIDPESDFLTILNVWNAYVQHGLTAASAINLRVLSETAKVKKDLIDEGIFDGLGIDNKNQVINTKDKKLAEQIKRCIISGLVDRLLIREGNTYRLYNGTKVGIRMGQSSSLFRQPPEMMISADIRGSKDRINTYAGLNEMVTRELIDEIAPGLLKEDKKIDEKMQQAQNKISTSRPEEVKQTILQAQEQKEIASSKSFKQKIKDWVAKINGLFASAWNRIKKFLEIK